MVSSSKFKPGIVALFAVGVVQQATALPQIELNELSWEFIDVYGSGNYLGIEGQGSYNYQRDCEAVAAALNSLKYGFSSISGVDCWDGTVSGNLYVPGGNDDCKAVAATLNSLKYGSSSISGVYCNEADWLTTDEPKDVELLNTLLAFSEKGYSDIEVSTAGDLADVKSGMATAAANTATDLADVKNQLADLKALLTPECTANRLARAQGNSANDPANSSDGKPNIAAIVVPIVAVLLVAAVVATVFVMKGRGNGAYAEVERRAANAPPATTQPNPVFTPADAADATSEPGSDEDIDL